MLDQPPLPPQQLAAGVPDVLILEPRVNPVLNVRFELRVEVGHGLVPKLPVVPSLPPVLLLAFQLIMACPSALKETQNMVNKIPRCKRCFMISF